MSDINFEVTTQGAPVVDHAYLHEEDVALVYIDLASKYCDVQWTGADAGIPTIGIYASEHALHLDETKDRDDITEIRFPSFVGWHVFAANSGRYTLTVVFTRNRGGTPKSAEGEGVAAGAEPTMVAIAKRNLRALLSKASFASNVDREAALNCVEVLEQALAAVKEN